MDPRGSVAPVGHPCDVKFGPSMGRNLAHLGRGRLVFGHCPYGNIGSLIIFAGF